MREARRSRGAPGTAERGRTHVSVAPSRRAAARPARSTSRRPIPPITIRCGEAFRGGDTLPFGVHAFEGFEPNDLVPYVETRRAVVVGDTLIDRGTGLRVHPDWPGAGVALSV